jgi:hypothetical protein
MKEPEECGVCGRWTSQGSAVESENKRKDGTTPMDNYVCWGCQREARNLREVGDAAKRYLERVAA